MHIALSKLAAVVISILQCLFVVCHRLVFVD